MMKGKTAEMKNMFNTLMIRMEGLTNPSKAYPVQVTPSKDLSRDHNINTAVSPKQQQGSARFRVTHEMNPLRKDYFCLLYTSDATDELD
eukprot:3743255-Ditylum_brightwellii.AAC.1